MTGLGKPELRTTDSQAVLTCAEYDWLRAHPNEVIKYSQEVQREYAVIVQHEVRSRAKKAVANR